jgi:hypothetical protein
MVSSSLIGIEKDITCYCIYYITQYQLRGRSVLLWIVKCTSSGNNLTHLVVKVPAKWPI